MDDHEILSRINQLVQEEHDLEHHTGPDGLGQDEQERLRSLEVALDQCWDLLRQRRARRGAGEDPEQAHVRDAGVVERYQQ
jgi:hypothetical protein